MELIFIFGAVGALGLCGVYWLHRNGYRWTAGMLLLVLVVTAPIFSLPGALLFVGLAAIVIAGRRLLKFTERVDGKMIICWLAALNGLLFFWVDAGWVAYAVSNGAMLFLVSGWTTGERMSTKGKTASVWYSPKNLSVHDDYIQNPMYSHLPGNIYRSICDDD